MERIEFPEKIKKYMIRCYKNGLGIIVITKQLKKLFDFDVSKGTVYLRLKEWGIEKGENLNKITIEETA
jgi:hypothetical protein